MSEKDLYRDTPVRLLGYVNEVGEAFRIIIGPKLVSLSYIIATLYSVADACDKAYKEYKKTKGSEYSMKKTLLAASDAILWQTLASVVVPGYVINRICNLTGFLLSKTEKVPINARKWLVPTAGLVAIPFIVEPIDHLCHRIMDETFRKATKD